MIKVLMAVLVSGLLSSCSILKKNIDKNNSRVDSTAKVVSSSITIKKKDSSGVGTHKVSEETKTDNGYTRVTTIKEYLSDEFDFSGGNIKKDSSQKVLIRETTIKEKGKAHTQTNKVTESANASQVNNVDSSNNKNVSEIALKKETKAVLKSIGKKKFLPGAIIGIVILTIAFFLYKRFK